MKGVFWFLLSTLACGVAVYWFVFANDGAPRQDSGLESTMVQGQPEPSAPSQPANPGLEAVGSTPEPVVATAPPIIVDSFAPIERMPLDSWSRLNEVSGHVDVFSRVGDGARVEESLLIEPTDILVAQGWAGNFSLGLQFQDVVLSACGQIVARAQVGVSRPDVATAIHPNLEPSGWKAQVLAADLPFCSDSQLRGWAIASGGQAVLVPLVGTFAYVSPTPVDIPNRLSAQKTVTPQTYPRPQFEPLRVTASKANLRKCGSTSCAVVGQITRGEHVVHIATRGPEWSLILFADGAGWLFNDLFETAR